MEGSLVPEAQSPGSSLSQLLLPSCSLEGTQASCVQHLSRCLQLAAESKSKKHTHLLYQQPSFRPNPADVHVW